VVDELAGLFQVVDHSRPGPADLPHRRRRPRDQDQEHARADLMLGQVLLGDLMLALLGPAVDHRNPVRLRGCAYPPGKPAGEAHQVRVVQLLIAVLVPPPPPDPEAARRMPQREVRVEDDPVHAVIAARQQIAAPLAEEVGHPPTLGSPRA
jgi:hypothetical protein